MRGTARRARAAVARWPKSLTPSAAAAGAAARLEMPGWIPSTSQWVKMPPGASGLRQAAV